ncbi:hypothetical protein FC093_17650 [Ilyomonas limi]|uniref:Pr6Pr family membrane protein n=1 Tax=Ilyomonas limi TaxID=2575867 RepID=A0A4U3KZ38_9BACT|nr:Pr6Pr family membrane protein [Ilyomonas limi]TKK66397.1 hypothetical protein FC093_17650 [Ilyomonas limi]
MNPKRTLSHTLLLLLIAVCAWLGVILQFATYIPAWMKEGKTLSTSLVLFFSFFTILTNLIVAIATTYTLLLPHTKSGRFCAKPATITAITLYIIVVGLVYNIILRSLYHPQGWGKVADEIVHSAVPLLYVIYWLTFATKGSIQWKHAISWLIYLMLYLAYTLVHGAASGYYPYPFMDVNKIGYTGFWLNSFYLSLLFLFLSFVLIGIDKYWSRKNKKPIPA